MQFVPSAIVTTLAVLSAVAATPAAPQQQPQAPGDKPAEAAQAPPVFRGGVELVSLSVTVTDKNGRPVTDLTKDDFLVFEDKAQQQILNFTSLKDPAPVGIGLGLVLDVSESMSRDRLEAMRTAVQFLLSKLKKQDELYLVEFATDVRHVVPWTTDRNQVVDTIRRFRTRTGTAIYDAIFKSLPISAQGKQKKQVMLVITDGQDYNSTIPRAQVADAARASDVLLYVLVVDSEQGARGANANLRQATGELDAVAQATGGRAYYLQGFQELEDTIGRLGQEFTQQYFMEFERPREADGKYHQILVGVKRANVVVRHRRGYVAD
jgi:Ca-activated chloride channel family protein